MLDIIGGVVIWFLAMFVMPRTMFVALLWIFLEYGFLGGFGLFVLTVLAFKLDSEE